ncbi:MAG: M18 family aminopeptidase [Coriobacteriia bacterium]|nr:M18 family aminopeptidase [Coriobacteriia bacterium]
MTHVSCARQMLSFIDKSPTCYQAVANLAAELRECGFVELSEAQEWRLVPGGAYFVTRNQSSLAAFRLPESGTSSEGESAAALGVAGFQIAAAHSDSPSLKIKSNPELPFGGDYVRLNVERYGGLLLKPWFDRPLSVAGRVLVRTSFGVESRLVDLRRNVAMIPSLAVHMDRSANEGHKVSVQDEMVPLVGMGDAAGSLAKQVAEAAGAEPADVLGSDLFLYNSQQGCVWGLEEEFVSSRQLDDLQCAWSLVQALKDARPAAGRAAVCAVFDNEEVGSGTKQGADSGFLSDVLARIAGGRDELPRLLANSFLVSADNAHGVHPNYAGKADPTNRVVLNGGVVVKESANQRYTTDAVSRSVFALICEAAGVPVQTFANHADIPGGSTLGNIASSHVAVNAVDIGLPQLAMHSPYETAGVKDTWYLVEAMGAFYRTAVTMLADGSFRVSA